MPFDAMDTRPWTLARYLDRCGVTPIPMVMLEAHKREQVRLHPPHRLHRSSTYWLYFLALYGGTLYTLPSLNDTYAGNALWTMAAALSVSLVLFIVTLAPVLAVFSERMVRGRAQWLEYQMDTDQVAFENIFPTPIREVVQRLHNTLPEDTRFVVGELVQRDVVLDPYLVVELHGERKCLGIWDDNRIITVAGLTDLPIEPKMY